MIRDAVSGMNARFSATTAFLFLFLAASCPFVSVDALGKQRSWIGPSTFITGAPSPREALGFAHVGGKFYVFGGKGTTGNRLKSEVLRYCVAC